NFPKAYELTIQVKVFDKSGHIGNIEWTFPQFKPDGNFELGFAAETPITTSMTGKILADEDGAYGSLSFQPVGGTSVGFTQLATSPSEVQLDPAVAGDSEQLTVIGIRGGAYSNVIVDPADLTFTSDDTNVATVSASGLVELGATAAAGN